MTAYFVFLTLTLATAIKPVIDSGSIVDLKDLPSLPQMPDATLKRVLNIAETRGKLVDTFKTLSPYEIEHSLELDSRYPHHHSNSNTDNMITPRRINSRSDPEEDSFIKYMSRMRLGSINTLRDRINMARSQRREFAEDVRQRNHEEREEEAERNEMKAAKAQEEAIVRATQQASDHNRKELQAFLAAELSKVSRNIKNQLSSIVSDAKKGNAVSAAKKGNSHKKPLIRRRNIRQPKKSISLLRHFVPPVNNPAVPISPF